MKIRAFYLLGILLIWSSWANATERTLRSDGYKWEDKRKRIAISKEDEALPAIILKHLISHEYAYDNTGERLFIYSIEHKIVRVNNDDALEQFNKIYLPVNDVAELVELKARSISPKGNEMVLDKSNIKEIKDKDGSRAYKIFAIEGAEKGSEIEYVCIRKRYAQVFGREFFQSEVPARNVQFELITPVNLEFISKSYNGFASLADTVYSGKRFKTAQMAYINSLEEEPFAFLTPNRMRVEYKLAYNSANGSSAKLFTYADAAKSIHQSVYNLNNAEVKAADKYFKSLNIKSGASVEDKVVAIENQLKNTINIEKEGGSEGEDITSILKNKWANHRGVVKLFVAMLKRAGINHEIVLTTDRSRIRFDKDFETFSYLDEFAVYINETDKYVAPYEITCRYGMIPYEWTFNNGLFIKEIQFGKTSSCIGEVRFIPTLSQEQSYDNLDINVSLEEGLETAQVQIKRAMGGYSSSFIQTIYELIPEENKKKIQEELIKSSVNDAVFKSIKVEGVEKNTSPLVKPFVIDAQVTSASLIEKAGNKYLFKFGELLGPQSEMYQDRDRKLDVENQFNRSYNRTIQFKIPEQYTIRNLKDIKMDVFYKAGDNDVCIFKSDYTLDGTTLKVTIKEYYSEITTKKEDYERFRKVVNAAADFNKVTLVLEKK